MAAPEDWNADGDFEDGPDRLFGNNLQSLSAALSSRLSIKSGESNSVADNWEFIVQSNDENTTQKAILSAKQAGIPIPQNVPSSALTGGTIRRLGKKKSRQNLDEDWGLDIDLPTQGGSPLRLKPELDRTVSVKKQSLPSTPADEIDDFDVDWAEGSLGVRAGGTKRESRNRSSSTSAMSPSMGSCMTLESEDDGIDGLVLPNNNVDFARLLNKRKEAEQAGQSALTSSPVLPSVIHSSPPKDPFHEQAQPGPTLNPDDDDDNILSGLDINNDLIDPKKPTVNRNIKITSNRIQIHPIRSSTTLTFTDKSAASRIPRPSHNKTSRLDPVYEPGAVHISRNTGRPAPTTTSSQLLRAKRSAPVLRTQYNQLGPKASVPFLPAGVSSSQSHHVASKTTPALGSRRDSNPERGQSPTPRPTSRMSRFDRLLESTPSRTGFRKDVASAALTREASTKRNIIRPARRRNFGDGTELDMFDDLPTSAQKEHQFVKQPTRAGPPRPALRPHASLSRLVSDRTRTQTPFPPSTPTNFSSGTLLGPTTPSASRNLFQLPSEGTPRFARDTAASRNAREQRLGASSSRDGPLKQVQTNWKAQVALRNPHLSPTSSRTKDRGEVKKPQLIKWMGAESVRNEKGMTYNLALNRWDGNENEVNAFYDFEYPPTTGIPQHRKHSPTQSRHHHTSSFPLGLGLQSQVPPSTPYQAHYSSVSAQLPAFPEIRRQEPSPPRRAPALISHVNNGNNVQVEKGMILDPRVMKWLKIAPGQKHGDNSPSSLSVEDEDDPFAGIEDLPDERGKVSEFSSLSSPAHGAVGTTSGTGSTFLGGELMVGEEFDVGPAFIRKQREEEVLWRRMVDGWTGPWRDELGEGWRWSIREQASSFGAEASP